MVNSKNAIAKPLPSFKHLQVSLPHPYICHCQLSRPPVNALNTAVWNELLDLLTHLETHHYPHTTRVLILSSASPADIFSAGNDLSELFVPQTTYQRFKKFWLTSTTFLARLYRTKLYTIAAVRGATPAGGCVMALCCDYRVALNNTKMGLNEVAIGLAVPQYWAKLFLRTCNLHARAERLLASGEMFTASTGREMGMLDEIVHGGREILIQRALEVAKEWAIKEGLGRAQTKLWLRREFGEEWEAYRYQECDVAWKDLSDETTIEILGKVRRRLSERSAKM